MTPQRACLIQAARFCASALLPPGSSSASITSRIFIFDIFRAPSLDLTSPSSGFLLEGDVKCACRLGIVWIDALGFPQLRNALTPPARAAQGKAEIAADTGFERVEFQGGAVFLDRSAKIALLFERHAFICESGGVRQMLRGLRCHAHCFRQFPKDDFRPLFLAIQTQGAAVVVKNPAVVRLQPVSRAEMLDRLCPLTLIQVLDAETIAGLGVAGRQFYRPAQSVDAARFVG